MNITRPENLITKTEKLYLMSIQPTEADYLALRERISETVKSNISNTKRCLEIYEKYAYLLSESRRVDDWVLE